MGVRLRLRLRLRVRVRVRVRVHADLREVGELGQTHTHIQP